MNNDKNDSYTIFKRTTKLASIVILTIIISITLCVGSVYYILQLHGFHEYIDIYHKKLHSSSEVDRNPIYINDVVLVKTFNKYAVIEDFGPDTVTLIYEDDGGVIKEITIQKDLVVKVDKEALLKEYHQNVSNKQGSK